MESTFLLPECLRNPSEFEVMIEVERNDVNLRILPITELIIINDEFREWQEILRTAVNHTTTPHQETKKGKH